MAALRLYHRRRIVRDRDCECDRGINKWNITGVGEEGYKRQQRHTADENDQE